MASIKGQPSAKPTQVANPVPGADAMDEADAFLADFNPPKAAAPAQGGDEADQFLASFGGETAPPGPDQFAPDSDPLSLTDTIKDNVAQFNPQNFITRVQAGLAANDTEKANFLKKKYGDQNVAEKDGKIFYRRNPQEKLRPLDPATFEVISDILPDFAREIVVEGAMLPAELGGAALGAPEGGVGAIPGAIMGRVASVPMANAVADGVADLAGVRGDETRNRRAENMMGMAAEAVLPAIGGKVVKAIAKRIPGTMAYKEAIQAGEKEVVALSRQSQEVKAASEALEKEGLDVKLRLDQVQPDSPKVQSLAEKVKNEPEFINKQQEFAEGYGSLLENTVRDIATRSAPKGSKIPPGKLATGITNAVESIEKAEGKAIGEFRAKAMANLKNKKTPIPAETNQIAIDAMNKLGFTRKAQDLKLITRPGSMEGMLNRGVEAPNQVRRTLYIPPKDTSKAYEFGLTDEGQSRAFINALNDYGKVVSRGGEVRLTDLDGMVNKLGPLSAKLRGTKAGSVIGQLQGELRTMRRNVIGSGLDETERGLFNTAMDDFGMVRTNIEDLKTVLGRDMTAKTIVSQFFKGGANKERVSALKKIVGTDSPEWAGLKEEFVNQLLLKHAKDGPTGFNSKGMLKDIEQNYGTDFVREVLNDGKAGPNLDTVKNLLTVGKRIEETQKRVKADTATEEVKKNLSDIAFGWLAGVSFKMLNGAQKLVGMGGGKESALMEIFNREGFEKYLAGYKGKNKGEIAKKIEVMMQEYNAARSAQTKTNALLDVGKDVVKRGVRADMRESLER